MIGVEDGDIKRKMLHFKFSMELGSSAGIGTVTKYKEWCTDEQWLPEEGCCILEKLPAGNYQNI